MSGNDQGNGRHLLQYGWSKLRFYFSPIANQSNTILPVNNLSVESNQNVESKRKRWSPKITIVESKISQSRTRNEVYPATTDIGGEFFLENSSKTKWLIDQHS